MKSKVFKFGLGSLFIVLMLVTALLLLRPIYNALNSTLNQIIEKYTYILEEKFNLELKIGSISPNILTRLKISDIQIIDSVTKEKILSVDSVVVKYKLKGFLSKSKSTEEKDFSFIQEFLTSITVNNTEVDWDFVDNSSVLDKIVAFVQEQKESSSELETKSDINFVIPCKIVLKNTVFHVSQNENIVTLKLPTITLRQKIDESLATVIDLNGNISLSLPLLFSENPIELSSNVVLQAILSKDLENSIARLQLTSTSGEQFSLSGLDFAADYTDKVLACRIFSSGMPFSVYFGFHTEFKQFELAINSTKFDPFSVIDVKDKNSIINKAKGSNLSGSYKITYGLESKDLTFFANGSLHVSNNLFKGGIDASYNIFGNLEKISVNKLICTSPMFDVDFKGSFDVKQLSPEGEMFINKFVLPSGKNLSAEIYVDKLSEGFICFIPQLIAGDDFLTALQLICVPHNKSLDFNFEAYDYSHYEVENPGKVSAAGSLLFEDKLFLQTSVSLENTFISGILQYASNFVKNPEGLVNLSQGFLSPYIVSLDLFASTDFSSLSYNLPYAVVANTEKDGEMLLLSLDGNETSIQVSRLDVTAMGQQLSSSFSADTDKNYKDVFFSANFVLNSIPYNFYGAFSRDEYLTLYGDYGFNFSLDLSNKAQFMGELGVDTLPIKIQDFLFTIETVTDFYFSDLESWMVNINNLKVIEESQKIKNSPTITLSARIDPIGVQLDSIAYGDSISVISGIGSVNWVLQKGILESASALIQMDSPTTGEKIQVDLSASNPFLESFSSGSFTENFYLTGQVAIEKLLVSHFLNNQSNNTLSLNISALGPLNNLYVVADIPQATIKGDNIFIDFNGSAVLEDNVIHSDSFNAYLGVMQASIKNLDFSLKDFSGSFLGDFVLDTDGLKVSTPLSGTLVPFIPGDIKNFMAEVTLEKIESSFAKPIEKFSVKAIRTPGRFDFIGGKNELIKGYLLDSGDLYASVTGDFPILFDASGSIKQKQFNINFSNIQADLHSISKNLTIEDFQLKSGTLSGNFYLGGLFFDPEFEGFLDIKDLVVSLGNFLPNDLSTKNIKLVANDDSFKIENVLLTSGKAQVGFAASLSLDRWMLEELKVHLETLNKTLLPVDCKLPIMNLIANLNFNLEMAFSPDLLDLRGNVDVQDTILSLTLAGNDNDSEKESKKSNLEVVMDLIVNIAPKSKIFYPNQENPIIRGLVSASKPIHIVTDSSGFAISGDLNIKGGEILYLSRNFYLKEGRIDMNEVNGNFDPLITFRAEIPEQDEYGEVIRIILSADAQRLSMLNPVLTSDPLKSDLEIRNLLGQAFIGDSYETVGQAVGQFAATSLDYLLQNSVFRQMENRLRDLFNFDIFSFRTQFFQEALKQVFFTRNNSVGDSTDSQGIALNPGNFFNNTTVYIGKYIGDTIYMDAMFSLVYKQDQGSNIPGKLVLQPEIGLELPTPFVNIRWSIAPDITSAQNLWVPSTSISLSWKFTF